MTWLECNKSQENLSRTAKGQKLEIIYKALTLFGGGSGKKSSHSVHRFFSAFLFPLFFSFLFGAALIERMIKRYNEKPET